MRVSSGQKVLPNKPIPLKMQIIYYENRINSLEDQNFEADAFGRVVKQAFDAHLKNDDEKFYAATRWLEGEFDNREISAQSFTIQRTEYYCKKVNLSLYRLIKLCGFQGTVIAFDG